MRPPGTKLPSEYAGPSSLPPGGQARDDRRMTTPHDTTGVHGSLVLEPDACWALLRSVASGRLAVAVARDPYIFPVNHIVFHETMVSRTAEGTNLAGVVASPIVAAEA